ncbi:hypothetical protein CVD27_19610 [Neobacillus cucumis]|uniref:Uncharacterized protein n=1 Tax=Neobacillus cucumis TaxID=1740721 RepID=A0A2N5HA26_9BACI|nr:hypothetical protein CVD27_19610 [Neobacillus cucumis]
MDSIQVSFIEMIFLKVIVLIYCSFDKISQVLMSDCFLVELFIYMHEYFTKIGKFQLLDVVIKREVFIFFG